MANLHKFMQDPLVGEFARLFPGIDPSRMYEDVTRMMRAPYLHEQHSGETPAHYFAVENQGQLLVNTCARMEKYFSFADGERQLLDRDERGLTPLHHAATTSEIHVDCVKTILASPHCTLRVLEARGDFDDIVCDAADMAQECGHYEIEEIINERICELRDLPGGYDTKPEPGLDTKDGHGFASVRPYFRYKKCLVCEEPNPVTDAQKKTRSHATCEKCANFLPRGHAYVTGLKGAAQYNGRKVVIIAPALGSKGRLQVELLAGENEGKVLSIKTENLLPSCAGPGCYTNIAVSHMLRCKSCLCVLYCSKSCQEKAWKAGHWVYCQIFDPDFYGGALHVFP